MTLAKVQRDQEARCPHSESLKLARQNTPAHSITHNEYLCCHTCMQTSCRADLDAMLLLFPTVHTHIQVLYAVPILAVVVFVVVLFFSFALVD